MNDGRLFRFVQFEFPWALGPAPGRYAIREQTGELPNQVLVLSTLGAPERRWLRSRRKPRTAEEAPAPEPVVTSRATLVDAEPLAGAPAAAEWLAEADLEAVSTEALARLNRVLHAHRVSAADPYTASVSREWALVVRVGYGDGDRVSAGRWEDARQLAHSDPSEPVGGRRSAALRPQERLAAILGGRDVALACEELTLRARSDLDAGRLREAALQLRAAYDAADAELEPWRERTLVAPRLDAVRQNRDKVVEVADAALRSGLDDRQAAVIAESLRLVEAALRARTAGGFE